MSENSNEEKLSFKDQILRDLERLKKEESLTEQTDDLFSNLMNSSDTKTEERVITPEEELIANSVSTVEQLIENAPAVPPRPDLKEEVAEEAVEEASVDLSQSISDKDEINSIPTKVSVSYRTHEKSHEDKGTVGFATNQEELTTGNANQKNTEVDELPKRSRRESAKPAKKKKKSRLKGFLVTVLVLLILLGAGGFFGLRYAESALQPVDPSSKQYMTVQIPDGSNAQEIGSTLEKSGVIKNGLVFTLYVKYKNYNELKSGYYNLQKSMSVEDVIKELQKGGTPEPQEVTLASLTIPEGYTLEQIAQTVGQLQGNFKEALTAEAFLAKVQDENFIAQEVTKYPNLLESLPTKDSGVRYRLEGYLFPATYTIKENTTVESLIDEMLAAMDKNLSSHYATIKEKNLTVNELLTIASLVEKEGAKTEDRKLIAGVFYNRLNLGMPLQSNIAILYAEGKLGQNISLADDAAIDTSIDSPYNDYTKVGLMPGPVDSPSLDAIESSINQTKSDYLYFVANVQDGKVYYATTLEEHDRNVQEHINSKLNQSNSTN
ncbi:MULTISPECIES: endolytic transglycosylase MltG [unclassified Streptococcus]|uniref:endolytic transglycosylase MltG n=1 Tax=unclassified Streptococcus TaxID=2608887 RepID=UPI0015C03CBE|nr:MULTISPECIES: endolytic transglycosylase MltG [unclassified Streptococcus]MCP9014905.1 endolytic transglycosylase MltG [Streptococcus sp. CF8_St5-17]QLF55816.1 endolytic transglycosylase MltG [Streptococcus sp. oral taxon 061]